MDFEVRGRVVREGRDRIRATTRKYGGVGHGLRRWTLRSRAVPRVREEYGGVTLRMKRERRWTLKSRVALVPRVIKRYREITLVNRNR